MCAHLCMVQIGRRTYPPHNFFTFFDISCEIPPYGTFHIEYWGEIILVYQIRDISLWISRWNIPRISKEGSEIPRGPEVGMYDAKFEPHITHVEKFCLEKIFWKCLKLINYWKERCFRKLGYFGQFSKKSLPEVYPTRPKSGARSWKIMRFWWLFYWNKSEFYAESDCEVRFVKQGKEM